MHLRRSSWLIQWDPYRKSEGVMDDVSGDDDRDQLTSEWGSEWEMTGAAEGIISELIPETGWCTSEWAICDIQWGDSLWVRKGDNRWGAGTARGLNKGQIVKIARLTGCKNFVGKRKKFIFNACLLVFFNFFSYVCYMWYLLYVPALMGYCCSVHLLYASFYVHQWNPTAYFFAPEVSKLVGPHAVLFYVMLYLRSSCITVWPIQQ